MIDLSREADVFVLRMQHEQNRFDADFIDGWNDALNRVEKADGPQALVTMGSGKFYPNGMDFDFMRSDAAGVPGVYLSRVLAIPERVLFFPPYSVATIDGHAVGAGS